MVVLQLPHIQISFENNVNYNGINNVVDGISSFAGAPTQQLPDENGGRPPTKFLFGNLSENGKGCSNCKNTQVFYSQRQLVARVAFPAANSNH